MKIDSYMNEICIWRALEIPKEEAARSDKDVLVCHPLRSAASATQNLDKDYMTKKLTTGFATKLRSSIALKAVSMTNFPTV